MFRVAARKVRFAATAIEAARDAGRLVHVLLDYEEPADVWAATTTRLGQSAKVRVCVGFLQEQLTRSPFRLCDSADG